MLNCRGNVNLHNFHGYFKEQNSSQIIQHLIYNTKHSTMLTQSSMLLLITLFFQTHTKLRFN